MEKNVDSKQSKPVDQTRRDQQSSDGVSSSQKYVTESKRLVPAHGLLGGRSNRVTGVMIILTKDIYRTANYLYTTDRWLYNTCEKVSQRAGPRERNNIVRSMR